MQNDLAALVGSRICHDLISPIGAIGNGVELLSLTDGDTSAEMALISESVENASARIRYFRIAYGAASEAQMVGRSEVLSILAAIARGGRFTYYWQIDGDQSRRDVRLAFIVMQCMESAMPLGGDIDIQRDGDHWTLTARAERITTDPALWDGLIDATAAPDHTSAQVQFALMPSVLADAGRRLSIEHTEGQITARF